MKSEFLEVPMSDTEKSEPVGPVQSKGDWGTLPQDNFGYASNEERREKRVSQR